MAGAGAGVVGTGVKAITGSAAAASVTTPYGMNCNGSLAMLTTFCHFGGIIVPPGYTDPTKFEDGNPYGVGVVTGAGGVDDTANAALDHLVTRVLTVAGRLQS